MIPGHPTHTTYRTIALTDYGVAMCGAQAGCPKGLGYRAHRDGKVDRAGTIHWREADTRASRRGMRNFLKLMGMAHNREWWAEPVWKRLYLSNVWAYKEAWHNYHYRIKAEWSFKDRQKAALLAYRSPKIRSLRYQHRNFYAWLLVAGVQSPPEGVQTQG